MGLSLVKLVHQNKLPRCEKEGHEDAEKGLIASLDFVDENLKIRHRSHHHEKNGPDEKDATKEDYPEADDVLNKIVFIVGRRRVQSDPKQEQEDINGDVDVTRKRAQQGFVKRLLSGQFKQN